MEIDLNGDTPAERWEKLRGHIKQVTENISASNEMLKDLAKVISGLRGNLTKDISMLQTLSDLANEEIQREISLTLNDADDDVVVDAAPPEIIGDKKSITKLTDSVQAETLNGDTLQKESRSKKTSSDQPPLIPNTTDDEKDRNGQDERR